MKAMVYTQYGSPDVLHLEDVATPTPAEDEVLVKIYASSVNAADWHLLHAKPFLARLDNGLFKPKRAILGADAAGRVEAVGSAVTLFKPGDEVFGDLFASRHGAFAEYAAVPERLLVLKPANITFEQAAAVPLAGVTALQALRHANVQPGERVLVNGATGGVGSFAVLIAKAYGAEVTGVCSPAKMDTVRSLGADHVIDYTQEDFTRNGQQYDVIIDVAANRSASDYKRALRSKGRYIFVGFSTMGHMISTTLRGMWITRTSDKKFIFMGTAKPNQPDLLILSEMLTAGKIMPCIDRTYSLSEVPDAIRYMESRRIHGKVVIRVAEV
ncbi:MAG TPA: NAD(P)-dependent alcohol dehydrogenase [Aggregatilinea sp.]|uniref:NAD(P)-dependent alcohol dehydrogenase n=1 Tax=Aggregatilinea sp. TaxID=2806333 RepID=UPI002D0BC6C9|nr:NAD(P)-dependent alcohol dehydrogenase [Aggregatilinea sp.]HML23286.1 NAD(P)-dependent alcohol dehydrogenase [Aggregatilinea sp.]